MGHMSSLTIDICEGGFSTELMRVLPPGTALTGHIRVGEKEVAFEGYVVWAKPGDASLNLRGRMGVRFTRMAGDLPKLAELSRS